MTEPELTEEEDRTAVKTANRILQLQGACGGKGFVGPDGKMRSTRCHLASIASLVPSAKKRNTRQSGSRNKASQSGQKNWPEKYVQKSSRFGGQSFTWNEDARTES